MDLLLGSYESGTINSRTRVDFKLANGATDDPDTTVMTLQANGSVGIGTTSPATKLDVLGSINSGVRVSDGTATGIIYASSEATNSIVVGTTTNHPLVLYTNNAARMTIDSSGKIGIGAASVVGLLQIKYATDVHTSFRNATAGGLSAGTLIESVNDAFNSYNPIYLKGSQFTFGTDAGGTFVERLSIDSSGGLITTPAAGGDAVFNEDGIDADFRVESDTNANALFVEGSTGKISMGTATTNAELYLSKTTVGEVVRADNSQDSWTGTTFYSVIFGTGNNNGTTGADKHFGGYAGGAMRYIVCGNGDVKNTNNSYGAYSDLKLKENIVDSGSQWDDIKALRVRKYSMKDEYSDVPTQIGVIAQELEAVGMGGLVTEGADLDVDNNDLGTTTKQVTYSVLYMKAVKALQEAMERIESLEARITALEL
jgi:hypothetical protein